MQSTCNHLLQLRLNVGENRRGNQEWTIQRQWQHWEHKTQDVNKETTKTQHNTEN